MVNTEAKIIGIHNQDPLTLYVQFSVGENYYLYERDCAKRSESIQEEFFGSQAYSRKTLNRTDKQFLLGKIMFHPKIKRAIKDYPFYSIP